MTQENERLKQTVQFLEWTKEYSGWWYLICTPNDEHMNPSMMKLLIERLAEKSFYEIIFVLIMVHRNEPFVDDLIKGMFIEMQIIHWEHDKEEMIAKFTDYLE